MMLVVISAKFVTLDIGSQIATTSLVLNDVPSLMEIIHLAEFPSVSGKSSTGVAVTIPVVTREVRYALTPIFANVTLFTVADDPDKYDDVSLDPPPPFKA